MVIGLNELRPGQSGVVRGVVGGFGMVRRLEALGLRPGKLVTKISSQFLAGPVTVMVDGRDIAIGRGMAAKVQVEPVSQR